MLLEFEQILRVMEYSRLSRHLLLTAGDDGTVHLWDTTSRSPKAGQFLSSSLLSFEIGNAIFLLASVLELPHLMNVLRT